MKKNKTLRIFCSGLILTSVIFSSIFFPIYFRKNRCSIQKYAVLEINTIECTDMLQNGSYSVKIGIVNRFSLTLYPLKIQGSQYGIYGMNTTIIKKLQCSFELNREDVTVFLKLRRGVKSEIVKFQLSNNESFFIWIDNLWFEKFGGRLRINYRFLFGW